MQQDQAAFESDYAQRPDYATFIVKKDVSGFFEDPVFKYTYELPTDIMTAGRRHYGSEMLKGDYVPENAVAWVIGGGSDRNLRRHQQLRQLPSDKHYNARHAILIRNLPGYFMVDRQTVRKFDRAGGCKTVYGKSVKGC